MQNTRPVAAIVSTNELFTPAHVSLESCLLQRLTVYRMEMWEEAVNVFCERVACVKDVRVWGLECSYVNVLQMYFFVLSFFSPLQFYDRQIGNTIWGGLAKMLKEAIYSSFAQVEYCMSVLCSMRFSFFIYYLVCPNDYTLSYQQLYAYVL